MEMLAEQVPRRNRRLIENKSNLDQFWKGNKSNNHPAFSTLSFPSCHISPAIKIEQTLMSSFLKISSHKEKATFPTNYSHLQQLLFIMKFSLAQSSLFKLSFFSSIGLWRDGKVTLFPSHLLPPFSLLISYHWIPPRHISCPSIS